MFLLFRRRQLEPSDAVIRQQAEALASLRVAVDVLQDSVRSVPVDVGGVRQPVTRERERLENPLGVLVGVLQRSQDERVTNGLVKRILGGADELLSVFVETLPLLKALLLIFLNQGQLDLTVETRCGASPVSLTYESALSVRESTAKAPYRHASDSTGDRFTREVSGYGLLWVLAISDRRLCEADHEGSEQKIAHDRENLTQRSKQQGPECPQWSSRQALKRGSEHPVIARVNGCNSL